MRKKIIGFTSCLLAISVVLSSTVIPVQAVKKTEKKSSVKKKKITIYVGKKKKILIKNRKKKAVYTFRSKNAKIVKVSSKGIMTAKKTGKTKISVKERYEKKTRSLGFITVIVKKAGTKTKTPHSSSPAVQTAVPTPVTSQPADNASTPAPSVTPESSMTPGPIETPSQTATPRPPIVPEIKDTPTKLNQKVNGVEYGEQITTQYYSTTTGKNRNVIIILPPGYTEDKKYPVLYLFHGGMGDENDWIDGGIRYMIGNMIANGEAGEMIVVLPNCRCREDDSAANADGFALGHVQSFDNFLNDFRDNLMPYIEGHYSVATGRDNTAVAGLSMGGRVALNIGVSLVDRVGYTGAFSPAYGIFPYSANGLTEEGLFTEETFTLPDNYNKSTFILINTGKQDNMIKNEPARYHEALEANGIHHTYYTMDGTHDWPVWRNGFYNFTRYLFQTPSGTTVTPDPPIELQPIVYDVPSDFDRTQDGVTYGTITKIEYYSTTTEAMRKANILLPAGYTEEKQYPVLYLLHGIGGDENEWVGDGKPRYILGNLISKGLAKEMIVVIPNCRARKNDQATSEFTLDHYAAFDNFINDLRDNLMPYIEEHYSIATGRKNTAIAGLSMGGRESLNIGLNMPETFGYIAAFSPGYGVFAYTANGVSEPGLFTEETFRLPDLYKDNTLLMINNGISDGGENAIGGTCHKALEKNEIPHLFYVTEGGHDFKVWKHGLYNFALQIFQ